MKLSQADPFGKIKPPAGFDRFSTDATGSLGSILSVGLRLFIVFAALVAMIYMLVGGFNWITSGGDKEKVSKAQEQVRNAVLGIFIIIGVLGVLGLLEATVFKGTICFGLTCDIKLPVFK